ENIIKTSALPHDSTPRVTSLDADEGSMQQQLQELMDLCTGLQRKQTQMADKIKDQDLEISGLKARVKILEDKERRRTEPAQEDAPIKGRSMEIGEEVGVERSTKLGSNDTEEMVNVLSSIEAANILTSEVVAVSVPPVAGVSTVGVPTVIGLVPTVSAIFTTASVVIGSKMKNRQSGMVRKRIKRINKQVEGMARHKEMYIISSHTKKIFANMRRIGAGFSGKKQKHRRKQRKEAEVSHDESKDEDHVPTPSSDPLHSGEAIFTLNKLMVFRTNLQEQVLDLQGTKAGQAKEIVAIKKKVTKLNKWRKSRYGGLGRLKKIGSCRRVKSPMEKDS
nr:hypothetical protein [Tanacetum cinerariifolium]